MRSEHVHAPERDIIMKQKVPSLVDLCVQTAIDNVRYLGDVGETDQHLLEHILPHCTVEQLMHVEDSTEGRDLNPVTDKLWKKFYESQFGVNSANLVIERMKQRKVSFKWRKLYEAKLKDLEEAQQKSFDRIRELYKKEDARKQSRQVQLCTKVPPSRNKRSFYEGGPGSNISNTKSSIMKKSKLQFLNCREVKNLAAMKKNVLQKSRGDSREVKNLAAMKKNVLQKSRGNPSIFSGKASSSTSKPMGRRF
ncbi:hypothetical protein U1Q18_001767 [Sarracenia purpurea var. burkii]